MSKKIDIVVVFFDQEILLLKLLMISIEKFFPQELLGKIIVINNSPDVAAGWTLFDDLVLPSAVKYKEKLIYVSKESLGLGLSHDVSAYTLQQALKLQSSRIVTTDDYLILDAKNHFIRPVTRADFYADHGKLRIEECKHGGYLKTCINRSRLFYGLDQDDSGTGFQTVTPYMMKTVVARSLLADMEAKHSMNIAEVIAEDDKRTEFFLYYAYMIKEGLAEKYYRKSKRSYCTLFARYPEGQELTSLVIARAYDPAVHTFSVHKRRFEQLSEKDVSDIIDIWNGCGLLSPSDGQEFIARQIAINSGEDIFTVTGARRPELSGALKIFRARSGRLFIDSDNNPMMLAHLAEKQTDDRKLKAWISTISGRHVFCQEAGVKYLLAIVPDTHAVYPECLPQGPVDETLRPVSQLLAQIDAGMQPLYLLDTLLAARRLGEPIHPSDSHWTTFGAFQAYKTILAKLPASARKIPDDETQTRVRYGVGDLGDKFSPKISASYSDTTLTHFASSNAWSNKLVNRGRMDLWVNKTKDLPSAILLTDSYGWKIQRFLAESFSWMFVIHSPNLERDAIEKYRPDVVVHLMAERFMDKVPNDLKDHLALHYSEVKGGNSEYPDIAGYLS